MPILWTFRHLPSLKSNLPCSWCEDDQIIAVPCAGGGGVEEVVGRYISRKPE